MVRWPLRSIFVLFQAQLPKGSVSWGSPGECHDQSLLVWYCRGFVLPVLEYVYCYAVWCWALGHQVVVSGASFLPGGLLECNLINCRSHAVLRMLYNALWCTVWAFLCRCGLHVMHILLISILMHLFVAEAHRSSGLLYLSQYLYGIVLLTACRWCGTGGFKDLFQCFFVGLNCLRPLFSLPFFYRLVLCGWGLWIDSVHPLSPSLTMPAFYNKIIIIVDKQNMRPLRVEHLEGCGWSHSLCNEVNFSKVDHQIFSYFTFIIIAVKLWHNYCVKNFYSSIAPLCISNFWLTVECSVQQSTSSFCSTFAQMCCCHRVFVNIWLSIHLNFFSTYWLGS